MELKLVKANDAYIKQIHAFRDEMLQANSSMDGTGPLRRFSDIHDWIDFSNQCANKQTVPDGLVQATQFLCVREQDHEVVGMIQVRHSFNAFLEEYGGHIGYSVRPQDRKKGYAKWMLHEILPFCKSIGLQKVLITCLQDNEGSKKTILANHGVFERTVYLKEENETLERYWISL